MTAASTVSRCASRSGSAALASVLTCPLATWLIRLPSTRITPQPVQLSDGSRPRIITMESPARPWEGRSVSPKFLHHRVGTLVISQHGLDVLVVVQTVAPL